MLHHAIEEGHKAEETKIEMFSFEINPLFYLPKKKCCITLTKCYCI